MTSAILPTTQVAVMRTRSITLDSTPQFSAIAWICSSLARSRNLKALAAGDGFTCALLSTGPTCWGANDRGQLGRNPAP
jgi:hypothetical protein